MIFIVVKTKVKPGYADAYLEAGRTFLEATRREPGNLWYDKYRSVDDPDTIVTIEAFVDEVAGEAHVNSPHFKESMEGPSTRHMVDGVPDILHIKLPEKSGWDKMAEFSE
jgi:quinol monooxygenase YgiN